LKRASGGGDVGNKRPRRRRGTKTAERPSKQAAPEAHVMYLIRDILLIFVLAVGGTAALVYFGVFDVSADVPHSPAVYQLLESVRQRSIEVHSARIVVPPLDDEKMVAEGAEHYDAMCTGCHLAPGVADTELRRGLYPQPPKLAEARGLPPAQAFWAIKHGIKLTAMPAWGTTHDNAAIWNIVAFLQKLPDLTPEQYQALTAAAGHDHEGHEHSHEHAPDHEHDATGDDAHDPDAPAADPGQHGHDPDHAGDPAPH
jgi:mono/diheme cytochrome c family protein